MEKSSTILQLKNCSILRDHMIIKEDLWIRNGKIINPEEIFFDEKILAHKEINCANAIISPGFIDLQINGGYGIDFSHDISSVEAGVLKVAKGLLSHGVTSFCPTLVTSPLDVYHTILPKIPKKPGGAHGATILGVHVEGPFINKLKKGAHPEEYIIDMDDGINTLKKVYGTMENVSIITVAPEKEHVTKIIPHLVENGIIVSVGHSMANLKQGEEAVRCGANLITHLFNAMLPFHHRDPGLVGLLSSDSIPNNRTVYYGIIADGVHTHPAALRIAHRTHPDGLVLVTDAISAMGLKDGTHHIGQLDVEIRASRAYIAGTNTLCGSIATMDECVRTFQKATNCTNVYALEAATLHPAEALGISNKKGSLRFGCDADLVFLDTNLNILSTWIAGELVYTSSNS